jgi:hypothetical protein
VRFRKRPQIVEANQFRHGATAPIGVRSREDGSAYVVTIQGVEIPINEGKWAILEDPPGDGTRAYPCADEVFRKSYELVQ